MIMNNKKLKAEKYFDNRNLKLNEERDVLEEKMKEGRIEIKALEEELKEIEKKEDNVGDIFQAKSTDIDPNVEIKKDTEDKIEALYSANTNYISAIKRIDNELKYIKEVEEEISNINSEKEEYKEKLSKALEELKEANLKENNVKLEKTETKETPDNDNNINDTNNNDKIVDNKEVEKETEENNNIVSEKELINMDIDRLINRLDFCKSLIGKDNQRASLLLSQMIEKYKSKNL